MVLGPPGQAGFANPLGSLCEGRLRARSACRKPSVAATPAKRVKSARTACKPDASICLYWTNFRERVCFFRIQPGLHLRNLFSPLRSLRHGRSNLRTPAIVGTTTGNKTRTSIFSYPSAVNPAHRLAGDIRMAIKLARQARRSCAVRQPQRRAPRVRGVLFMRRRQHKTRTPLRGGERERGRRAETRTLLRRARFPVPAFRQHRRPARSSAPQLRQRVLFGNVGRPAVGLGDRGVEIAMRVGEPLRARAVEIGQRALLQFGGGLLVLRQDAVGIWTSEATLSFGRLCAGMMGESRANRVGIDLVAELGRASPSNGKPAYPRAFQNRRIAISSQAARQCRAKQCQKSRAAKGHHVT
jgi:hypothetical protein